MVQAATANTDELLSQLASSEIDRLLAEADGNPAPPEEKFSTDSPRDTNLEAQAKDSERAALLQAAGFDSPTAAAIVSPVLADPIPAAAPPMEDERAALLQAAGFESPDQLPFPPKPTIASDPEPATPDHLPIYLKPLVWLNAPLDACPSTVRPMLGKVGIVTLLNALAVLTYVFLFRKH